MNDCSPLQVLDVSVATPSKRLTERVRRDFASMDADAVLELLETIPESLPLAERQDPERLQASLVLPARGNFAAFLSLMQLARTDWRDALVGAGLGNSDWPTRLDADLKRP